jgi:integrase
VISKIGSIPKRKESEMAEKLKSGSWRVRYENRGKRYSETFPNKDLALKFEAGLRLGKIEHLISDEEVSQIKFCNFAEKWLAEYCRIEKAESQWFEDHSVIVNHLNPAFGEIYLNSLKKLDLSELKLKLQKAHKPGKQKSPYAPKTINNVIGLAKKIMNTAVEWELISRNPFQDVKKIKVKDQDFSFWRPEERDQFLSQCDQDDEDFADAVLVACHTGLRLGELAGLTWEAVDFDRRVIAVRDTYSFKLKKSFNRTKTHAKSIHLPMNDLLVRILVDRKGRMDSNEKVVFPGQLLRTACCKLQTRCRRYGIKEIRFHDLRHTFASCLAMAGVDLMVIKELMRHQSYQMTLRYAHLHPDHLVGATDVLVSRGQSSAHAQNLGKSVCPRFAHETRLVRQTG